ncbi:hypothetical protein BC936DRAFT_142571 [Jimgerdemannia flammicorona]|uniref:Uncharacterized protein n=1 Tax=Jimgerdemannia flammicorona TaxID=994334 RepID=A0A433A0G4_9FUNG|nr:hypothetical protein BC936DRAFT_142571 [Jimgerdemannia flammicorona]
MLPQGTTERLALFLRIASYLTILFVCSYLFLFHRLGNDLEDLYTPPPNPSKKPSDTSFTRLSPLRRLKISSVRAHIRTKYVYNRMPVVDTPRFLVNYMCIQPPCGNLPERLCGLATSFYLALLNDKTAFSPVWTFPVRLDLYFEIDPRDVVMNTGRGLQYLNRTTNDAAKWTWNASPSPDSSPDSKDNPFSTTDFIANWTSRSLRIISLRTSTAAWPSLILNPSLARHTGDYGIYRLTPSEMFVVVHRTFFARPTPWFRDLLQPYRDLLGGDLDPPSLASAPPPRPPPPKKLFRKTSPAWFRIGIHLDPAATAAAADLNIACLAMQAASVCRSVRSIDAISRPDCHVFIASSDPPLVNRLGREITRQIKYIRVHSVDPISHPPADLDALDADSIAPPSGAKRWSAEELLKRRHARGFMEWTLLSRMDYLLGVKGDPVLETAAWAAQVQLELLKGGSGECRFMEYDDW